MIEPTEEQEQILKATKRVIKINARAGTGKTETLRLIAEHNPGQRILYLVFNKKNQMEAQGRFPENVKIRTVHAFALASLAGQESRFIIDDKFNFNACAFLQDFAALRNQQVLASLAHDFMIYFLNSSYVRLEEAVETFCKRLPNHEPRKIFSGHQGRIITAVRHLSKAWDKGESPCAHDFYLKLSQLKGTFIRELEKFDLILVDEGQDLSRVMLDALFHCGKRIVLVGDTHQGIYGFRHAVDAMCLLEADQVFDLSLSFRFGEAVAALAACFIMEAKDENSFTIRGNKKQKSVIAFYRDLSFIKPGKQTAILSRTNLGLFRKAMFLRARERTYRFERDIKADLFRTLDVYRLCRGEREQIKDLWIKSFEGIEQLDEYAERLQDFRLSSMSQIVKEYASEFPAAIFEMIAASGKNEDRGDQGAVILSTVHTAKGQQYDQVIVDEDVSEALSRTMDKDPAQFQSEVNVAYVCLTRVKEKLWLPEGMKTILTPAWQAYMESFVPKPRLPKYSDRATRAARSTKGAKSSRPLTGGTAIAMSGKGDTLCVASLHKDRTGKGG